MDIDDLLAKRESNKVKSIEPDKTVMDMAAVLHENKIGSLVVTDQNNDLIGIASERDIVRAVHQFPDDLAVRTVSEIMTKNVITCKASDGVRTVLSKMNSNKIRHIPVVEGTQPIAMISVREFEVICNHLQQLAWTDELTGLPNRRFFMENIDVELSKFARWKQPFSVALLDIDHFKKINDNYGHDIGDRVLVHLAEIFRNELRAYDIAGRIGGEEFGILFPGANAEGAASACEHLASAIRRAVIQAGDANLKFTASMGIAEASQEFSDAKSLIKKADEFLYKSKSSGRDRVLFEGAAA